MKIFYLIKQGIISNDIIDNFKKVLSTINKKTDDKIYLNTLYNLIFCLLMNENYIEAIFYLNLIKVETIKIQKYIINSYLLHYYIFTGNIKFAQQISEIMIMNKDIDSFNEKYYQRINNKIIPYANFKIWFSINMIKMCILNGKNDEIEKYLFYLSDSCKCEISSKNKVWINSVEDIPLYIINIAIYYYFKINRKDLAIYILKTKKVKQIFLQNTLKNNR